VCDVGCAMAMTSVTPCQVALFIRVKVCCETFSFLIFSSFGVPEASVMDPFTQFTITYVFPIPKP